MNTLASDISTPVTTSATTQVQSYKSTDVQGWEADYLASKKLADLTATYSALGISDRLKTLQSSSQYTGASSEDQVKLIVSDFQNALKTNPQFSNLLSIEGSQAGATPLSDLIKDTSGQVDSTFVAAVNKLAGIQRTFGNIAPAQAATALTQDVSNDTAHSNQLAAYDVLSKMFPDAASALDQASGTLTSTADRVTSLLGDLQSALKSSPLASLIQDPSITAFLKESPPTLDQNAATTLQIYVARQTLPGLPQAGLAGSFDADFKLLATNLSQAQPQTALQQGQQNEADYYSTKQLTDLTAAYKAIGQGDRLTALQNTDLYKNGSTADQVKLIVDDFATALKTDPKYSGLLSLDGATPGHPLATFLNDGNTLTVGQISSSLINAMSFIAGNQATFGNTAASVAVASLKQDVTDQWTYGGDKAAYDALSRLFPDAASVLDKAGTLGTEGKIQSLLVNLQTALAKMPQATYQQAFLKESPPTFDQTAISALQAYAAAVTLPGLPLANQQAAIQADITALLSSRSSTS